MKQQLFKSFVTNFSNLFYFYATLILIVHQASENLFCLKTFWNIKVKLKNKPKYIILASQYQPPLNQANNRTRGHPKSRAGFFSKSFLKNTKIQKIRQLGGVAGAQDLLKSLLEKRNANQQVRKF